MNVYNKAIIGYIKMLENFIYCLNSCINCFNIWLYMDLFPRATSQVAMLAWIFGDCREGQIPAALQRCKFDTPLLAAGYLIGGDCIWGRYGRGT